jgi:hypothetical protein
MNGIIKLELGGKERVLRFNNYSAIELSKILYTDELATNPDMNDISNRIMELNAKNHYLLMKTLIYSGILGNDFVVGFKETVTSEEVGEWIGDLKADALLLVWEAFWSSMGVNLPKDESVEVDHVEEKKT